MKNFYHDSCPQTMSLELPMTMSPWVNPLPPSTQSKPGRALLVKRELKKSMLSTNIYGFVWKYFQMFCLRGGLGRGGKVEIVPLQYTIKIFQLWFLAGALGWLEVAAGIRNPGKAPLQALPSPVPSPTYHCCGTTMPYINFKRPSLHGSITLLRR